jgi:hypothetical protein
MKKALILVAVLVLAGMPVAAGPNGSIVGDYVEVRTAEVYTGGCIMGSEGEPGGREAIMAWHVSKGSHDGITLDGLSVVAVVAADTNLGMHALGGAAPTVVKSVVMVDARASEPQRKALVAMARAMSPHVSDIVTVSAVPVTFVQDGERVKVAAGPATLDVLKKMEHDPGCGAAQWFEPLSKTTEAEVGVTKIQRYSGDALGARWEQTDRKSAFFGRFAY